MLRDLSWFYCPPLWQGDITLMENSLLLLYEKRQSLKYMASHFLYFYTTHMFCKNLLYLAMDQTWHFHGHKFRKTSKIHSSKILTTQQGITRGVSTTFFPILEVFSWMNLCLWKRHVWSIAVSSLLNIQKSSRILHGHLPVTLLRVH